MKYRLITTAAALTLLSFGALAQNASDNTVQRDVWQQKRIEQGLQSGSLTAREAARLEKEESRVDRMQARDMKDGHISAAERARLQAAQDQASRDIALAKHNGVTANPLSTSSQRMQVDVQRNLTQERRIEGGLQNGSLTHREAAALERGQARVDQREARAGANGSISAAEQKHVQRTENRQSHDIYRQKHDAQVHHAS